MKGKLENRGGRRKVVCGLDLGWMLTVVILCDVRVEQCLRSSPTLYLCVSMLPLLHHLFDPQAAGSRFLV
jgi:hypothetical protein